MVGPTIGVDPTHDGEALSCSQLSNRFRRRARFADASSSRACSIKAAAARAAQIFPQNRAAPLPPGRP